MFNNELMRKYAEVLVKQGANVQKGQPVRIRVPIDCYEFARFLQEEAYKAGASRVQINYQDAACVKTEFDYISEEEINDVADYRKSELEYWYGRGCCTIGISSPNPEGMKGVNPKKMGMANKAFSQKIGKELENYFMSNKGQWVVAGYPNKIWAKQVFPNVSEEEAVEKLWRAILETVRVSESNDPVKEWDKHNAEIKNHCDIMNKYNFKELHYKNSLGTNLIVKLPEGHVWAGGCEETTDGRSIIFNPNMPTEEVFTAPHRDGVDGIVYASKPLVYAGNIINNFWIKFEKGKIVEFDAKEGKEYLEELISTDEGSHYLGEVALVPYHSPISQSGILFYSTLFDENASCHLAIGAAYETCVKNTEGKSEEELKQMGINSSMEHCDFMVGTSDLQIIGVTHDGKEIPVFVKGDFAF